MDSHNHFETKTTFALHRLEWFGGLVGSSALALTHAGDIRWPLFAGLFVVIDVIGYLPGAVAFRRSPTADISHAYYVAYNVMHSLFTWTVLLGLWAWLIGPEWALLAVPIHLLGDRALFGNSLKPFGVSFEPVTHPAFTAFEQAYDRSLTGAVQMSPSHQERTSVDIDA